MGDRHANISNAEGLVLIIKLHSAGEYIKRNLAEAYSDILDFSRIL